VRATVGNDTFLVGNGRFLESQGVGVRYFRRRTEEYQRAGLTVIYVSKNGKLQGMVVLKSTLRPQAAEVIKELRRDGIVLLCLISGDREPVVKSVFEALNFDHFEADLLPEQKAAHIDQLTAKGLDVLMVGDGINDALALSRARVGVAMGAGGSPVAVEAADIALVRDELRDLLALRCLSHQTLRRIQENFWIATGTNFVGIVLGGMGLLTPVMAGILHISHTMGIMANSSRLLRWHGTTH
jgi:cation-transporting P-type ATPase C